MPAVFTTRSITNHHVCDSRADFHNATPFHAIDHTKSTIKPIVAIATDTPSMPAISLITSSNINFSLLYIYYA